MTFVRALAALCLVAAWPLSAAAQETSANEQTPSTQDPATQDPATQEPATQDQGEADAAAASTPPLRVVFNAMSAEASACFSYYSIVGRCVGDAAGAGFAAQVANAQELSQVAALTYGENAGMSLEAILQRSQSTTDSVFEELGGDCRNLSVLREKYGLLCKAVVTDPDGHLQMLATEIAPSLDMPVLPREEFLKRAE